MERLAVVVVATLLVVACDGDKEPKAAEPSASTDSEVAKDTTSVSPATTSPPATSTPTTTTNPPATSTPTTAIATSLESGGVTTFRPYVADSDVCVSAAAREFGWTGRDDHLLRPFALSRDGWHRFQVIADPELGADGRWALVGTLPANYHMDAENWNAGAESEFLRRETINGWPVSIETSPRGYAAASIDLGGDTDAYVRTYGFDLESLRALISALAVRNEPIGFDYAPVEELAGLEPVIDRGDDPVTADIMSLECVIEGRAILRISAITGDPLVQYVAILDQPYPYEIGRIGDAVVAISGFELDDGPRLSDVTPAPDDVWTELLTEPRPSSGPAREG